MQIQDALQGFLKQLRADGRSPHTIGQYVEVVRSFLAEWVDVVDLGLGFGVRHYRNSNGLISSLLMPRQYHDAHRQDLVTCQQLMSCLQGGR